MSMFLIYDAEAYEYLLQPAGYVVLAILMLGLLAFILFLGKQKHSVRMSTRELVFCAICMALATVTSFLKLASLPFGGSVTLFSMLFIALIGYFYGPKTGLIAGAAYGILQLLIDPYIFAPLQVLLDYPLAFGALGGLGGIFYRRKHGLALGYICGVIGRYICHVISGYVFFAEFAPEGTNPFFYTVTYNATYIVPEMILTAVLLFIPAMSNAIARARQQALSGAGA